MRILVTGAAGFIGSFLCKRLLEIGNDEVIGLDNINNYYDTSLKHDRLSMLKAYDRFVFVKGDVSDKEFIDELFARYKFEIVVHLAAQAGVRYSIDHPDIYIQSNIVGFFNILEACRHFPVHQLIYASSSSVYGGNSKVPFSVEDKVDRPVSLYAATKKSNELLAYSYSKLYGIPTTGLRFFTVYGPMGRPDMAYFKFANTLLNGGTINLYNYGNCKRDFTYIDDIVGGIVKVMSNPPKTEKGSDGLFVPPYRIYNIGNNKPESLLDFVNILSEELVRAGLLTKDFDITLREKLVPMQAGDVAVTFADISDFERDFGFKPSTPLREGLKLFVEWYKLYYEKKN